MTVTGNQDNLARCHYSSLAPGASYNCRYGTHTISNADVTAGSYVPQLAVTGQSVAGNATSGTTGESVDLSASH
ncbi:hypothetical protein [Flexivirga alba]|uniref:Uncharacterized protein n=1 Tax=Flexivirga alba TaxID=702742 RepID=A0ABW2AAI9_9MICO